MIVCINVKNQPKFIFKYFQNQTKKSSNQDLV